MSVLKIAAGFACGLIGLLFILTFSLKNPETALYEETIEMLMAKEGKCSEQELVECYPILREIQTHIHEIAQLNQIVQSKSRNPAPMIDKAESLAMQAQLESIYLLRKIVREALSQLILTYE